MRGPFLQITLSARFVFLHSHVPVVVFCLSIGLGNEDLLHQKDFDEGFCSLLTLFLQRQTPPVCLVAHNGHNFDFPLLKAELRRLDQALPEGILCADSLEAVRSVEEADIECAKSLEKPKAGEKFCTEDSVSGANTSGRLPVPTFYTEQQFSNNVTPDLQTTSESHKKNPPPAPCGKRFSSRTTLDDDELLSVRKRLFLEGAEESGAPQAAPPGSPGTPVSDVVKSFMEGTQNIKVKKRLFRDSNPCEELCPTTMPNEMKNQKFEAASKRESDSVDSLSQKTVLYWAEDQEPERSQEAVGKQFSEERKLVTTEDKVTPTTENASKKDSTEDDFLTEEIERSFKEAETARFQLSSGKRTAKDVVVNPSDTKKQRVSYNLREVHKRIVGYDMRDAHNAESDCLALLRIFHRACNRLCPWVDEFCIPFEKVGPLYLPKATKRPKCLDPKTFPHQL